MRGRPRKATASADSPCTPAHRTHSSKSTPQTGGAWFKLYGKQVIEHHTGEKYPFSHSVAKIQLFGDDK